MDITLTIPDDQAERVTNALSAAHGAEPSVENAKAFIVAHIQRTVISVETAAAHAAETAEKIEDPTVE